MPESDSPKPARDDKSIPTELSGLDPRELIARTLRSDERSSGAGRWEPPPIEAVARLLPHFQIEALIGRGGMGAVYKGTQLNLDRPVAIKLLPVEMAANSEFIDRFKREARSLARLHNSHIVTIYDTGETAEGHFYFVMEYVDGTNLREILKGPGLKPEQALLIVGQLCEALQAAHQAGFVHRDIKPENVLLTGAGEVKLADFGLARAVHVEEGKGITSTNVMMGTFGYMAPEQQAGLTDRRADIYALGVMLYEMLTGEIPQGAFERPSERLQIDVRIDDIVFKALQTRPERRYQHAGEMKTDVDRVRDTPGQGNKPPPKLPRSPLAFPRKVLIAAGIALVAVPGVVPLLVRRGRDHPDEQHANSREAAPGRIKQISTKEHPFVNSLGMRFVSAPEASANGADLLCSIWETRVKDFEAFVKSSGYQTNAKINNADPALHPKPGPLAWNNPGFPQTEDHPVVGVSFQDATAFCRWLTTKEREAGSLEAGQEYRLPTDREWSGLFGVIGEPGDFPEARRFPDGVYSWGTTWPPPANAENFAGEEQTWSHFTGYRDDWAWTAPVGAGKPNSLGIFDLSGNVREFCKDRRSIQLDDHVVRGSSYQTWVPSVGSGGARGLMVGLSMNADLTTGFRCVLDRKSPGRLELARKVEAAISAFLARAPADDPKCRDRTDYLVNEETVVLDLCGVGNWPEDEDLAACFGGLPVERLYLTAGSLHTFTALQRMSLKVLALQGTDCPSFDALAGLHLEWFHARNPGASRASTLEGLREMKLKGIELDRYHSIADLSPLRGQPLELVSIFDCAVADLSPLKEAPLRSLTLSRNKLGDVTFLDWWPRLRDFSGMDYLVEEQLILPALVALCSGNEALANEKIARLETRFQNAPWLGKNALLRDLTNGQLSRFARWAKGDRAEVAAALKIHGGHAYLFVPTDMHWNSARSFAEQLGGHLVTVTSKEEDDFLRREVMPKNGNTWLGLKGEPGTSVWKWITGEPLTYADWDPSNGSGQAARGPDQYYACWHPNGTQVHWWDYSDFNTRTVIVEWEVPNPQDVTPKAVGPLPATVGK